MIHNPDRISTRRGSLSHEPRHWRVNSIKQLIADMQAGPNWPRIWINPEDGIMIQAGPGQEAQPISGGAARWAAVRLIEAAALWEQGQTGDVATAFGDEFGKPIG